MSPAIFDQGRISDIKILKGLCHISSAPGRKSEIIKVKAEVFSKEHSKLEIFQVRKKSQKYNVIILDMKDLPLHASKTNTIIYALNIKHKKKNE